MPTKKKIDDLDIQILKYLQNDARRSLKKLADKLKKKTSTIYHRLQRLKSNDVILGYSIVINPEYLNIHRIGIHKVKMKPLNISSLDGMFLSSFANFIKTEFPEVLFIALSEDSQAIYLISFHSSEAALNEFLSKLKENPYISDVDSEYISNIVKGQKLFNFNEEWIKKATRRYKKDKKKKIEEEESELMEINLDEEDEEEFGIEAEEEAISDLMDEDESEKDEDSDIEIKF
ncbi:MAG: Lrp/AsnC family transcriptional regulator [Candidatus Lokiarchaeota archaeon]|nr:Lrp/AsnC family transcriptional regulator [Candidatus Harpocratesius repetitus]